MTSQQITNQIEQHQKRAGTIEAQLKEANQELLKAHQTFDPLKPATQAAIAAQSRVTFLEQAATREAATIKQLQTELTEANTREARASKIAQLATIATRCTELQAQYIQTRDECARIVRQAAESNAAAMDQLNKARNEAQQLFPSHDSTVFQELEALGVNADALRTPAPYHLWFDRSGTDMVPTDTVEQAALLEAVMVPVASMRFNTEKSAGLPLWYGVRLQQFMINTGAPEVQPAGQASAKPQTIPEPAPASPQTNPAQSAPRQAPAARGIRSELQAPPVPVQSGEPQSLDQLKAELRAAEQRQATAPASAPPAAQEQTVFEALTRNPSLLAAAVQQPQAGTSKGLKSWWLHGGKWVLQRP